MEIAKDSFTGTTQRPVVFPTGWEVDFNGTKAVSEIDVFTVQDNFQAPIDPTLTTTFTLYGVRNFEVQY